MARSARAAVRIPIAVDEGTCWPFAHDRAAGTRSEDTQSAADRFASIMAAASVAAFIKDPEGRYLYANAYMLATLSQHSGHAAVGKTDADLWPIHLAARIRAADEATLFERAMRIQTEDVPHRDGMHTYLVVRFPIPGDDGRMHLAGIGVDHTRHQSADAERSRLVSVVEQVSESLMITNLEGRITYVNPAFEMITGFMSDEVVGRDPHLLSSGVQSAAFYEQMWAALAQRRAVGVGLRESAKGRFTLHGRGRHLADPRHHRRDCQLRGGEA